MRHWKFFVGSCILVGGLLFKLGAPLMPLVAGIAAAAVLTRRRRHAAAGSAKP
jgi:hypothetical protein